MGIIDSISAMAGTSPITSIITMASDNTCLLQTTVRCCNSTHLMLMARRCAAASHKWRYCGLAQTATRYAVNEEKAEK